VKAAAALHRAKRRRKVGQTLVEGPGPCRSVLDAGLVPVAWFTTGDDDLSLLAEEVGAAVFVVTEDILRRVAATEHPRGPVAVVAVPPPVPVRRHPTLVLAGVAEPGNAGALIRSAAAFGYDVACAAAGVDPWAPKTVRAAAGAHFATRIARFTDLDELRAAGLHLVATAPRDGVPPDRVEGGDPPAILVGSEAHGLDETLRAAAGTVVTISTTGRVESLNVAVAGGIVMYAMARRRLEGAEE